MRAWILRAVIDRMFKRLGNGDTSLALKLASDTARFRFPGRHPFSADYGRIEDVADWLERFAAYRPRLEIDDVAVKGPPSNARAFVRYRDRIESPPRNGPYENEVMSFARVRWFKITEYVVYLDTQKVARHFGTEAPGRAAGA